MSVIEYTPSDLIAQEFPEFSKITVFGTSDEPLFPVTQVQEFLEIKNQIRLDMGYEKDEDYIQIVHPRPNGGKRLQNLLTEDGLYRVLFKCEVPLCKKFRRFIKIVMLELRLRGHTVEGPISNLNKLEDGMANLELQINKKEELCQNLNRQLEESRDQVVKFKRESERFYTQQMAYVKKVAIIEIRIRELENQQSTTHEYKTTKLMQMFMNPLFIYLAKPPKQLIDDFLDFEDGSPTDDDEICFEVSTTDRGNSITDDLYIHKGVTMKQLAEKLRAKNFTLMVGEKMHHTKYRGSIDNIRELINNMV